MERVAQRRLAFVAAGARNVGGRGLQGEALEPGSGTGWVSRTIASSRASVSSRRGRSSVSRAWSRKQVDKPFLPGNRGVWVKTKFLNRQEFGIVGWTVPEGSRSSFESLLLGYYRDGGQLIDAGRAGTGITESELRALLNRLRPLASDKMSVDVPPPKTTRFGAPLVLSRVHWVRPELVAEVTYLTWTADGLLRLSSTKVCARTRRRARFAASV